MQLKKDAEFIQCMNSSWFTTSLECSIKEHNKSIFKQKTISFDTLKFHSYSATILSEVNCNVKLITI